MSFCSVEKAVEELKKGRFVVIVDSAERENEGDLVCAAKYITKDKLVFMLKHCSGIVCAPISKEVAQRFSLSLMTKPEDPFMTPFTVSVDAAKGISTGVSAADRVRTLRVLASKKATEKDLVRPGHVFPLLAREGGVLERAGHTEATVDLLKMASLPEVGVLCELMEENGEMMRLPAIKRFCKQHNIKMISIEQIIKERLKRDSLIEKVAEAQLPTCYGTFKLVAFRSKLTGNPYLALVKGDIKASKQVLVRVQSGCTTGEALHSLRCDCGEQLSIAMKEIVKHGTGVLLYIPEHEGRSIGLLNKIKAYELQDEGLDTVEANHALGFGDDLRDYGIGAQVLRALGVRRMVLLTNNPRKVVALRGYGLEITKTLPLRVKPNKHNRQYLETKRKKLGHTL
jgi:3,4-dihydroxy 2-butanone 4-phosphate synthase/GTP cyclohydrolase II